MILKKIHKTPGTNDEITLFYSGKSILENSSGKIWNKEVNKYEEFILCSKYLYGNQKVKAQLI